VENWRDEHSQHSPVRRSRAARSRTGRRPRGGFLSIRISIYLEQNARFLSSSSLVSTPGRSPPLPGGTQEYRNISLPIRNADTCVIRAATCVKTLSRETQTVGSTRRPQHFLFSFFPLLFPVFFPATKLNRRDRITKTIAAVGFDLARKSRKPALDGSVHVCYLFEMSWPRSTRQSVWASLTFGLLFKRFQREPKVISPEE